MGDGLMPFDTAPLHETVARAPAGGRALWTTTADGLRLRLALWQVAGARGTIFLLPGRTEYIEKYGLVIGDLTRRGFDVLVLDWRGQGLSDRPFPPGSEPPEKGHIDSYDSYQRDLEATIALAGALDLPRPWSVLAHSMAGAIVLRALTGAHPFAAVAFSAPMWGVGLLRRYRPLLLHVARHLAGRPVARAYVPGSGSAPYVHTAPFSGNLLTRDAGMWGLLVEQVARVPDLTLGGPSLNWAALSLLECQALAALPSPDLPCLTVMGSEEKVIDAAAVQERMARWPNGRLEVVTGARHEVLMDAPEVRTRVLDACAALFDPRRAG